MNLRKWAGAAGVLAASVAVALAASTPASAAEVDGWTANLGTTVEAVDSANVLVMAQQSTSAGTSLERVVAGNVHVELPITFTFKLSGPDARCGGGAPRVYLLGGGLYGQLTSCPSASSGWMSVTAADLQWWSGGTQYESWPAAVAAHQGTPLGQVGLVWDNAAGQDARLLAKDIVLAGDRVALGSPEPDPTATATPTATPSATAGPTVQPTGTVEPTATASETGSPSPTTSESESESPGASPSLSTSPASGVGGGGLPLTGASVLGISGLGLLAVVGGISLFLLARRRRDTEFEA